MKNITNSRIIDGFKETNCFLSEYYENSEDEDYKTRSFYSALNDIVGIIPKEAIYQNRILYDIANIKNDNFIDNIIYNLHHPKNEYELSCLKSEYQELINEGNIDVLGVPISFYNETWDLTKFAIKGKDKHSYIYHFSNDLDFQFNTLLRTYILMLLYKFGPHATSTSEKLTTTRKFLITIQNEYGIESIENIKCFHLKRYIEENETNKYRTTKRKKQIIKDFLDNISLMTNIEFGNDIRVFLSDIDLQLLKAETSKNKTPLLPYTFYSEYEKLVCDSYLNLSMPKHKSKYKEYFSLGALAAETQLGIRTEEITTLHKDCLHKIEIQGEIGYYVRYYGTKPSRSKHQPYEIGEVPINEYGAKIIEKLIKESRKAYPNSDYLIPDIIGKDIRNINNILCIKNARELNIINRSDSDCFCTNISLNTLSANSDYRKMLKKYYSGDPNDFISLPTIKQCRVYVSTYFWKMGATHEEIRKIYIHKSSLMDGYYVRDDHPVQEDMNYSNSVLKQILEEQLNILGPKGSDYQEKINSFIQRKDIRIKDNLDAIITDICNEMPIRSKYGGFCIKANPNRPCNIDSNTDELVCAYNMCPNHCFLYFMLPESYKKCQQYLKIIDYNLANNFDRSAEKEAYILKNEIEKCLEIEIKETENEILRNGKDNIIKYHPNMSFYIENLEQIKEEVKTWKKKIQILTELN